MERYNLMGGGKGSRRSTMQSTSTDATSSSRVCWPRHAPQVPALPRTSQHLGLKGIEKFQKINWTDTETSQHRQSRGRSG